MIERKIAFAEDNTCLVLVIPFTLCRDSNGRLNRECIAKPVRYLESVAEHVHLVYLRKAEARNVEELDSFMRELRANVVPSEERYATQAEELARLMRR